MINVELNDKESMMQTEDFYHKLFYDTSLLYNSPDEDLNIILKWANNANAYYDPNDKEITISYELIESIYAYSMSSWLFYKYYCENKQPSDIQFEKIHLEDNFKHCVGLYNWGTKKYFSNYNTSMKYNDIINFPVIMSIMSKMIMFLIGHEISHGIYVDEKKPDVEFSCDLNSVDSICNKYPNDLLTVFYSVNILFSLFISVKIQTQINIDNTHPDPILRLKRINTKMNEMIDSKFDNFIKSIMNLNKSIGKPTKIDALYGFINSALFFSIVQDDGHLLNGLKNEYDTHKDLSNDLYNIIYSYNTSKL